MIDLHLFSYEGENGLRRIVEAGRVHLKDKPAPLVAYLPLGSLENTWQGQTEQAFEGLARVATLHTEMMTVKEMEAILRSAALLYIPGGNTYLLNYRLHLSKIMDTLRRKVAGGLPVVAFSAGTVLCGENILTSNDMNIVPTAWFNGLEATHFNLNVHYPEDPVARAIRDDWLSEYHLFHDNPVILMADGAYVRVEGKKATLVRGEAWILRQGQEKEVLQAGKAIE